MSLGTILEMCEAGILSIPHLPLNEQVEALNKTRLMLHEAGPFAGEPVGLVEWVPAEVVHANDYNPNSVAPPEMELLRLSIMADGYTQPIVTYHEDGRRTVIDGFHRNRVGKECADVAERVKGYLPVVRIRSDELRAAIHANDVIAIERECLDLAAPFLRMAEQLQDKKRLLRREARALAALGAAE
jgi:ParB-like chromosome segregation protein Spo0J